MASSLAVPYASLRGVQEPRITSVPAYTSSAGAEAADLYRMAAGTPLDPWQQQDLVDAMGEAPDWKCPHCTHRANEPVPCPTHPHASLIHPWAAFEVTEIDPRQNGKSEIEIARELAGLYILEEPLQIYSAHLFDTSIEIFLRLETLILGNDELRREVKHRGGRMIGIKHSHGEEGIELRSGCRIRFKARTGSGGRGFSCDRLALDEAMILREQFLGATVPTLSARPNPQIWLYGSAPDEEDPTHYGVVLAKRRARALAGGDKSLAYFERSANFDGDPDTVPDEVLDDPEEWARANPGLGIRITPEYVENERRAMGARQFAVERLGIGAWPSLDDTAGRVITDVAWSALADPTSRIDGTPTFAIDVDPDQAWATIAAAGKRSDGLFHIGVVEHARGTGWVVPTLVSLMGSYPKARLVVDPHSQSNALLLEIEVARLRVIRVAAGDYAQACGGFLRAVNNKGVRYMPPQPELDAAVAAVRTTGLLDAWKWSRKDSSAVITPVIADSLALWGAQHEPPKSRVINLNAIE